MAKKYRRPFYNLFAWPSVDHLSGDDQLDMLTASMGDDGPIKAVELKVYDTAIILNRILTAAQQEIQLESARANSPSWFRPLMDRIVTLANTCLECEASTASPQREALPMLMLKLGRLIEAAELGEPFSDGLKEMGVSEAREAKLRARNIKKAQVKSRAQEIAAQSWANDDSQTLRIGAVALIAWGQLIDEGFTESMPDKPSGIHSWIRPVAPAYASRPGKR